MALDFRAPVTPRHRLVCAVAPVRLGETSVEFRVEGRQDGVLCFEGRFVCVFSAAGYPRKAPPPAQVRALIESQIARAAG
jgi:acyl-CoA thioesterase FadM